MNNRFVLGIVLLIVLVALFGYIYIQSNGSIMGLHMPNSKSTSTLIPSTLSTTIPTSTTLLTTSINSTSSLPPIVKITSPRNASTVNKGLVNITTNITSVTGVAKVGFYINSTLYATVNSAPYQYVWNANNVTAPEYTITVKAYGNNGAVGQASVLVDIGLVQHGK